jgi:DEAD/DEAH box helicase domain-containing protein
MHSIVFLGLPSSLTLLHDYLSLFASTQPHSLSLLLLTDTAPLERYVLRYPAVYQTHWSQAPGVHPSNPQMTQQHLLCAAAELALGAGEPYVKQPGMAQHIEQLVADQDLVRRTAAGDWITAQRQIHRRVRLRTYEPLFAVVHELDGQLLTRVRPGQAFRDYFEGATFTHGQQSFHVERLLTERRRILVRPRHTTSVTRGLISSHIAEQRLEASFSKETFCLSTGRVSIVETLQGYEHLDPQTYRRISIHRLPAQHRQLRTQATWLDFLIPAGSLHFSARTAVHTFIHAILAGLPLLWLADNIPHAGVLLDHENTENIPGVVLFDETAGGNGVSAFLYHAHTQVWRLGLQMLLQCDCAHGCFHCITGDTCGVCAQEVPLDRQAGIALFQRLLGEVAPTLEQVRLPDLTAAVRSQETRRPRHLYLCLTTQKSADEVGGWQHKHLLGLGVAVTYDTQDERYRVYTAETVEDLLASLRLADLVIGFNVRDFDYQVLQPYTTASLAALPTLAILDDVQEKLGYRLSFTHLLQETLGINRPDESLHTLQWFHQGERNRVIQHCRRDIMHLRALVRHGARTGHVWYRDRTEARQAFAVNWQFAEHDG